MFKESETVELKEQLTPDINKEIVAFANTKGGTIYIGVADSGDVIGVNEAKSICERTAAIIDNGIKPDLTVFTNINEEKADGKVIVRIEIRRGTRVPYYISSKGMRSSGIYVRSGNTSVPATETAIRKMISDSDGTSYESVRCMVQELTFYTAEREFAEKNIEFGSSQKRTLGITDEEGIYTNLGLLLSDQCGHTIKAAVFEGKGRNKFRTRKEFSGSLFKQLSEAYDFICLNNDLRSTFSGLNRIDRYDYSETAIREVLLNAIVHRDYSFGGSTLISVFSDRLEISSLGGLVRGLELEDIFENISQTRNPKLCNVFYRLNYIEAYGTGIEKIRESCGELGVIPKFYATNAAFRVVIPNSRSGAEEEPLAGTGAEDVLMYITREGAKQRKDIQEAFGLKLTKCNTILRTLESEKKIARIGKGRNTRYMAR